MSTNSRIGIENENGTITSIYCHWDGYPEHNGKLLLEHWTDREKVEELIKLGNLSDLGQEIGEKHSFKEHRENEELKKWCLAFGRDRGDEDQEAETHGGEDWEPVEDFNYLFTRNGEWLVGNEDQGWYGKRLELSLKLKEIKKVDSFLEFLIERGKECLANNSSIEVISKSIFDLVISGDDAVNVTQEEIKKLLES